MLLEEASEFVRHVSLSNFNLGNSLAALEANLLLAEV